MRYITNVNFLKSRSCNNKCGEAGVGSGGGGGVGVYFWTVLNAYDTLSVDLAHGSNARDLFHSITTNLVFFLYTIQNRSFTCVYTHICYTHIHT